MNVPLRKRRIGRETDSSPLFRNVDPSRLPGSSRAAAVPCRSSYEPIDQMCRLGANLRLDGGVRNSDEVAALQPCWVCEYGSVEEICLGSNQRNRMPIPVRHRPHGG